MQVSVTNEKEARAVSAADVEQSALKWLRDELDDPEITGADNFLDIGGHSLTFSKLNIFLGDSFGIVLDMKTTYDGSLAAALAAAQPSDTSEPSNK
ncbi:hypothetical protein GCM10018785_43310 [Streptomyces longispororuber]|uniref:Carrier domain-containing protein n=1 Tax=Streptomyces longispororuber TaxID=68230 RepID=A0A919DRC9_9ACTN|nr:hypothetical protein GCM10018785_43310 [Streptomyces longispororuber]